MTRDCERARHELRDIHSDIDVGDAEAPGCGVQVIALLSQEERAAIEHDFRMQEGKLEVTTRVALADYFIWRHNLDLRDHPDVSPQRAQLSLQNLDEVKEAVVKANEESKLLIKQRATVAD